MQQQQQLAMAILPRLVLLLNAGSLLSAGLAVQTARYDGSSNFALTLFFCLSFAVDTLVQSGALFSPTHVDTADFFSQAVRPLALRAKQTAPLDFVQIAWNALSTNELAITFATKLVPIVFTFYLALSFVLQCIQPATAGAAAQKRVVARSRFQVGLVHAANAALLVLAFSSCADVLTSFIDEQRAKTEFSMPRLEEIAALSNALRRSASAHLFPALVTQSLLLASLSWQRSGGSEFFGLQHTLALRWASTLLSLMQTSPKRLGDVDVVCTLWLPAILVGLLFVLPRYAMAHPIVFALIWALLGAASVLVLQPAMIPRQALDLVRDNLDAGVLAVSLLALASCGGLGITGSILTTVTLASIHAKDLLK